MKTILAIETSSPVLSVALGTREGKVREIRSRGVLRHSENLIPFMDRLLRKEKLSLPQIDAFAIDRGPGSFTGLRIGLSLLKGFLAAEKRPCYGALSLDMIASNIRLPEESRLGVLVDARRDALYARFYRRQRGEWNAEGKPELLSFRELTARLREGTRLVGDALIRYRDQLEGTLSFPQAATLVRWFQARDRRLVPLKTPQDFLPLYFRMPEAEEKKKREKN